MIFGIIILFVALTISAVAAFYSIVGLTALFASATTSIIIMGASLEIGKIISTVWLHKYWDRASLKFKLYLVPAIIILMLVTSMGIFGYLSASHLDQGLPSGDIMAQVQLLDDKIKTELYNIEANKKTLQQLDSQVDQLLSRTDSERGATHAVKIRSQQVDERRLLQESVAQSQKTVAQLQNERLPIAMQVRKVEAEIGPVKYIAALMYGDNPDSNTLEHAVRWVIILLIIVFDPLAIVLILVADQTMTWSKEDSIKNDTTIIEPLPEPMASVLDQVKNGDIDFKELSMEDREHVLENLDYNEKKELIK